MSEYTVPHVHTAVHKVLGALQVDKNGVLPGNMGGKPYIQAPDVAAEVKSQFYANNLIVAPHEEVVKHETIILKDRINIAIVVSGTYDIISTVDGSSLTIVGTGDGLAGGTAVASNIASTNAFKNAFLRFLLITEQSVEDEAKNGPAEAKESRTVQKVGQASASSDTADLKKQISALQEAITEKTGVKPDVNKFAASKWPGDPKWFSSADKLGVVVKALQDGELV